MTRYIATIIIIAFLILYFLYGIIKGEINRVKLKKSTKIVFTIGIFFCLFLIFIITFTNIIPLLK